MLDPAAEERAAARDRAVWNDLLLILWVCLLVFVVLLLAACTAPPVTIPVVVHPPPVAVPSVTPLHTTALHWQVYNKDGLRALVDKLDKQPDQNFVLYALDTASLQALVFNLGEMKRYIEEQQEIIKLLVAVVNGEPPAAPTPDDRNLRQPAPALSDNEIDDLLREVGPTETAEQEPQ